MLLVPIIYLFLAIWLLNLDGSPPIGLVKKLMFLIEAKNENQVYAM